MSDPARAVLHMCIACGPTHPTTRLTKVCIGIEVVVSSSMFRLSSKMKPKALQGNVMMA